MSASAEGRESFGRICERVCAELGWELLPSGVRVPLPDGRSQVVDLDVFDDEDRQRARLSTRIGPLETLGPQRMEAALRVNAGLAHGALAIREDSLIMTDTIDAETADARSLELAIRSIGAVADRYEQQIFGTDEN